MHLICDSKIIWLFSNYNDDDNKNYKNSYDNNDKSDKSNSKCNMCIALPLFYQLWIIIQNCNNYCCDNSDNNNIHTIVLIS